MMDTIKNIIFDLGGVIYDIQYENIAKAFTAHGVQGAEHFYGRTFQTPEMDLFETGMMTAAAFRDYIRRMTQQPLTDAEIDDILNAILVDIPQKRIDLLLALRQRYALFLFSNTNQINYDCYTQAMKKKYHVDVFEECFDACYFSHLMHKRKPAPDGFEQILAEQHLAAGETLFVDDNVANTDAARRAGLHAYLLKQGDVADLFAADLALKPGIVQ